MKAKSKTLCLVLVWLAVLACSTIDEFADASACSISGGTWHPVEKYCEHKPTATPFWSPVNTTATAPQEPTISGPTGEYLTVTPASAQSCDASKHMVGVVEIIKEVKETYYRDCDYRFTIMNIHPSDPIWIVWRQRTVIHSTATNSDDSYLYAELIFPNQSWEKEFRSSYFTNGQTSENWVDMVAAVYDRLDCLYLLRSNSVETIGKPAESLCAP